MMPRLVFNVYNDKDQQRVRIQINAADLWISFVFTPGSKFEAELLRSAISDGMCERIKSIREKAYTQGRKDVRKGEKKTYFNPCINTDEVGY